MITFTVPNWMVICFTIALAAWMLSDVMRAYIWWLRYKLEKAQNQEVMEAARISCVKGCINIIENIDWDFDNLREETARMCVNSILKHHGLWPRGGK